MSTILEAIEGELDLLRAQRGCDEERLKGVDPDSAMAWRYDGTISALQKAIEGLMRVKTVVECEVMKRRSEAEMDAVHEVRRVG